LQQQQLQPPQPEGSPRSSEEVWRLPAGAPAAWDFLPEWEGRSDPAPAQLVELAALRQGSLPSPSDVLMAAAFSPDGRLLATGSLAKRVSLYSLGDILTSSAATPDSSASDQSDMEQLMTAAGRMSVRSGSSPSFRRLHHSRSATGLSGSTHSSDTSLSAAAGVGGSDPRAPVALHRLPAKVSCLAWSWSQDGVVYIGDHDGTLTQLHVCSGHQLAEVDAHGGRRVWGVAHSPHLPHLLASASDDCTVRLWSGTGLEVAAGLIRPPPLSALRGTPGGASVCGLDFSPVHEHLLALASAGKSTASQLRIAARHLHCLILLPVQATAEGRIILH
jgi:WD40 repeat protein